MSGTKPRIVFVVRALDADWPDIGRLDEASLDREHARFRRGMENWIVQTYLRMRGPLAARGIDVRIASDFEAGAICVAHRDDLNRYGDAIYDCFVVGVRADRPPIEVAQIEVVQNPLQADPPRRRLIPHWPQPGLVPRDASRGTRVRSAAYLGRTDSMPRWYSDAEFLRGLAELGIAFEARNDRWNDYSSTDVLLAHREETPVMLRTKPASKLVNAWLAGTPAILFPEPAFEHLRRGPLDFVATSDAPSTLDALRALQRGPSLYRAMVENGRARSREFDVEALRGRWMAFFLGEVVPAFEAWRANPAPLVARIARHVRCMTRQKLAAKRFRREERLARVGVDAA